MKTKKFITEELAVEAAKRWSCELEDGTMHFRSLERKVDRYAKPGLFIADWRHVALVAIALMLALIACVPAIAQTRKDFDLERDYGLTYMQGKLQVKNITADTNAAKAKYPRLAEYLRVKKFPITKLMNMNVLPAAWNDAVLQGQSGDIAGVITSRNGVDVPDGDYDVNYPCFVSMGDYRGKGTGYTNPTPSVGGRNMNTCLRFSGKVGWIGTEFDQMNLIQSSTWGVMSGAQSYIESGTISGFRLEGDNPGWHDPSYTSNGLAMWDMGETWTVDHIFSTNHNGYGIINVRGTPATYNTISLFTNALGGIGLIGTELSSVWINGISGDDNPALIVQVEGYGRGAGGNITITGVKSESGKRSPNKGQIVLWQRSPCVGNVTVAGPQADMNDQFVDAQFVMNSRAWGQTLNVQGFVGWNLRTLVHDITNGKRWAAGAYEPRSFAWCSRGGGTLHDLTTSTLLTGMAVTATDRLGLVPNNGTFDYTSGTPKYSLTGGGTAPPPPTACSWVAGARTCSACVNYVQTCTTPYVSSVSGCTPSGSKPADIVETVSCGTPPSPPSSGGIDPNDVLVVSNSADSRSAGWAQSYATAWGIPSTNIIAVNAGTSHDASASVASTIKSAVDGKGKQYTVMAWEYPSRVGSQSITSYVTFGQRTVSSLTASPLYNYTGLKPRADKGVAPSYLLLSDKYIRKDAHGTRPQGQAVLLLARDETGTPRGSARASQSATGVTKWDNRSYSGIGNGENQCNWISNECWKADRKPGNTPIIAAYQSMFILGSDGGATWAKGFYGDHITSFGGFLPAGADGKNAKGQTALNYHLNRGASLSVGSVSEPWQGSGGSLTQQFVDISIFHPLFLAGQPVGVAAWAAVKCPDRMLFAGDPLCSPFR